INAVTSEMGKSAVLDLAIFDEFSAKFAADSDGGLAISVAVGTESPIGVAEFNPVEGYVPNGFSAFAFDDKQLFENRCDDFGFGEIFAISGPVAEIARFC